MMGTGQIVVMTGAGVSAESGIPTFRGKEGYWEVGSREYHPQELATWSAFSSAPQIVWPWYLYRRALCRNSNPNQAHFALVELEAALGKRFKLVTQNVDGLHIRAGSTLERCYEVHGNIDYMRCSSECGLKYELNSAPNTLCSRMDFLCPVPDNLGPVAKNADFNKSWEEALRCAGCGAWMRPHVLWFDESYDELKYRFESSLQAAMKADLLITAGSSGATNLPMMMAELAMRSNTPIIDVNIEANPFSKFAGRFQGDISATASDGLPPIAEYICGAYDKADD